MKLENDLEQTRGGTFLVPGPFKPKRLLPLPLLQYQYGIKKTSELGYASDEVALEASLRSPPKTDPESIMECRPSIKTSKDLVKVYNYSNRNFGRACDRPFLIASPYFEKQLIGKSKTNPKLQPLAHVKGVMSTSISSIHITAYFMALKYYLSKGQKGIVPPVLDVSFLESTILHRNIEYKGGSYSILLKGFHVEYVNLEELKIVDKIDKNALETLKDPKDSVEHALKWRDTYELAFLENDEIFTVIQSSFKMINPEENRTNTDRTVKFKLNTTAIRGHRTNSLQSTADTAMKPYPFILQQVIQNKEGKRISLSVNFPMCEVYSVQQHTKLASKLLSRDELRKLWNDKMQDISFLLEGMNLKGQQDVRRPSNKEKPESKPLPKQPVPEKEVPSKKEMFEAPKQHVQEKPKMEEAPKVETKVEQPKKETDYKERTFIMIKPDGVQRREIGKIIRKFEDKGLKLVAMKMVVPDKEILEKHYEVHKGKPFYEKLLNYVGSGPVVPMVWQGPNAVLLGRQLIGKTQPVESDPSAIRGQMAVISGRNLIHGSDSVENANLEVSIWFSPEEIQSWDMNRCQWIYEKYEKELIQAVEEKPKANNQEYNPLVEYAGQITQNLLIDKLGEENLPFKINIIEASGESSKPKSEDIRVQKTLQLEEKYYVVTLGSIQVKSIEQPAAFKTCYLRFREMAGLVNLARMRGIKVNHVLNNGLKLESIENAKGTSLRLTCDLPPATEDDNNLIILEDDINVGGFLHDGEIAINSSDGKTHPAHIIYPRIEVYEQTTRSRIIQKVNMTMMNELLAKRFNVTFSLSSPQSQ